jgi:hypothetical protein
MSGRTIEVDGVMREVIGIMPGRLRPHGPPCRVVAAASARTRHPPISRESLSLGPGTFEGCRAPGRPKRSSRRSSRAGVSAWRRADTCSPPVST